MGGWVKQGMGIKKTTCCDKYRVWYGTVESLNCTPETNIILCVNWNLNKNLKKKVVKSRVNVISSMDLGSRISIFLSIF